MIGRENAQTNFANSTANEKVKAQLKSFYRGEVSAVETYQRALEHSAFVGVADVLRSCQASHQQRVGLLRETVRHLLRSGRAVPGRQAGLRLRRLIEIRLIGNRANAIGHLRFI